MLELRPGTDSIIFWIGLFFPWYEMWPYFLNTFLSNSQHYVTPSMNFKISQLLRSVNYRASQVAVVVKNLCANAGDIGDMSSIPGLGRSLEEEMATHSNILAWRIPMDRGAWWAIVHGVAKSQTRLKQLSIQHINIYVPGPLLGTQRWKKRQIPIITFISSKHCHGHRSPLLKLTTL